MPVVITSSTWSGSRSFIAALRRVSLIGVAGFSVLCRESLIEIA